MKKTEAQKAMSKLGSFGGKATKEKYGPGYYKSIADKRWAKRKELKKPSIVKGGGK